MIRRFVEQVHKKSGLPSENVFETLADDADHLDFPPADRFITVTPQRFALLGSNWAGGGRYTPSYDGVFRVACISRFASDQEFRNTRELRDKARAAIALNLAILDCLSGFTMPTDDESGSYLREPISNIDYDFRPKKIKQTAWAVVASQWAVGFVMALPGGVTDP